MKRLIKRFVLKAQVDRENDEVNEGKMCSSLRPFHIVPLFAEGMCALQT